jgi:CBS domain containing-hemolysin-like protein
MLVNIISIVFLSLANAFFVASEIALTSISKSHVSLLADKGDKRARSIERLLKDPEKFYSVIQVGITIASLGLGAVGTLTVANFFLPLITTLSISSLKPFAYPASVTISFILISYVSIVIGELAPKTYAFKNPEKIALFVARPIECIYRSVSVFITFLNRSSEILLQLFGVQDTKFTSRFARTEDQIRGIIDEGYEEGILGKDETQMIHKVFEFTDKTIAADMTPRPDIVAVPRDIRHDELLKIFRSSKHSRIPVYDENIDNMIGVVFVKDLLDLSDSHAKTLNETGWLIREIYAVPDTKPQGKLLREFMKKRTQMAIVLDEFGGTAGLITMEDLLESIVGEIDDEYDTPKPHISEVSEYTYAVDPGIAIEDFNDMMNTHIVVSPQYATVGGFILTYLGRRPEDGDQVVFDDGYFEVKEMTGNRITSVVFKKIPDQEVQQEQVQ